MKKIKMIALALAALMVLSACSTVGTNSSDSDDAAEAETEAPEVVVETAEPTEAPTEEPTPEPTPDLTDFYNACADALENVLNNFVFPDGFELMVEQYTDIYSTTFSIFDADSDGELELYISYTDSSMAGMVAGVYSYDEATGTFTEELNTFPALTFYDNGTVTMGWSHNQGLAGEFWPYTVYQYNADTGAFENVGYVDAWQKEYFEEDWSGNPFPDDVDADGDGFVYFLNGDSDNPADGAEYEAWRNSLFGTANVIEIGEQYLTQENIDSIRR